MIIAITTPTGNIGRKTAKRLLDKGNHQLVLLARNPDKLKAERDRGAKVVQGDLTDVAFVKGATVGADALLWIIPPDFSVPNYRAYYNQIAKHGAEAARTNSIKHAVLLSSVGAHLADGTGPILGLRDAERIFSESTQRLTCLRPAFFMENYLWQIEAIKNTGSVMMPLSGDVTTPMIATADIAERAALVLTGPIPDRPKTASLHGPKDYRLDECAKIISEIAGREIKHAHIPSAEAKKWFLSMGATENVADTMLEMYDSFQKGKIRDEVPRGQDTTTPTSFEVFASRVLGPALKNGS